MDWVNWILLLSLLYFPASLGLLMYFRHKQQRTEEPSEKQPED